jgi:NADPH-dependent glutamate synthase beta subunit-like oxidoreductase
LENDSGQRPELVEKEGSEKTWPCDLALLALGFTGPENLSSQLGLELDMRTTKQPIIKLMFLTYLLLETCRGTIADCLGNI